MKKLRIWMVITLIVGAMSIYYQRSKCGNHVVPVANAENVAKRLKDFNTHNLKDAERTLQQMYDALEPMVRAENRGQSAETMDRRFAALRSDAPNVHQRLAGWTNQQSARLRDRGFVRVCENHTQWNRKDCIQLLENAAAIRCDRDFEACTHDGWYAARASGEWAQTLVEHIESICPQSMTSKGMCVVAGKGCKVHAQRAQHAVRLLAVQVRAIENAAQRVKQASYAPPVLCESR